MGKLKGAEILPIIPRFLISGKMRRDDLIFWNFDTDPIFTGTLVGCIKSFGVFKKPVFVFRKDKRRYGIWGTAVITKFLYSVEFETTLKLKYLGKQKTDSSRYPVKLFEIEII